MEMCLNTMLLQWMFVSDTRQRRFVQVKGTFWPPLAQSVCCRPRNDLLSELICAGTARIRIPSGIPFDPACRPGELRTRRRISWPRGAPASFLGRTSIAWRIACAHTWRRISRGKAHRMASGHRGRTKPLRSGTTRPLPRGASMRAADRPARVETSGMVRSSQDGGPTWVASEGCSRASPRCATG
jgi:hypothetical protein